MTSPTLLAMLTRTATITHRAQTGAVDRNNEPTWVETVTTTSCYIEQSQGLVAARETVGRETQVGLYLGVFPSGIALDGSDEVIVDTQTFEVVGPPWRVHVPGEGEHHVEANLREIV